MVPGPIPQVLNNTASSLVGLAGQFLPDIVQALNKTDSMYTVFAPNNEAITAAQSALAQVAQKDQEALEKAVQGHVLDKGKLSWLG